MGDFFMFGTYYPHSQNLPYTGAMRKFSVLAALLALPLFGCGGGGTTASAGNVGQNQADLLIGTWRVAYAEGDGKTVYPPGRLDMPDGYLDVVDAVQFVFRPDGTYLEYGDLHSYSITGEGAIAMYFGKDLFTVDSRSLTITSGTGATALTVHYTRE